MTFVQSILLRSTSSRFGNVPPYPSVVCDKGLAEMSKEVCVVCAADYSYFRSVRGDGVTQTLICFKDLKTSLPSDVYIERAFHGELRYSTPRNITSVQAITGTHPTCPHRIHSRNSSSSTISLPLFCFSGFLFPQYPVCVFFNSQPCSLLLSQLCNRLLKFRLHRCDPGFPILHI